MLLTAPASQSLTARREANLIGQDQSWLPFLSFFLHYCFFFRLSVIWINLPTIMRWWPSRLSACRSRAAILSRRASPAAVKLRKPFTWNAECTLVNGLLILLVFGLSMRSANSLVKLSKNVNQSLVHLVDNTLWTIARNYWFTRPFWLVHHARLQSRWLCLLLA